jgi:hypothetical protein
MANNVIELSAVRDGQLFNAHRASITEFICAYTHHMNEPNPASLERFLSAQEEFVIAWLALNPDPEP